MREDEKPEEEQSEFNSAIATLKRIDIIKKGLIESTVSENHEMQFKYLKAYFKELVSIMNKKDDMTQRKRFHEVRKNYYTFKDAIRTGKKSIPGSIIDSFDDWEIELKEMEQQYGMNMPKRQDSRFALARR